MQKTNKIIAAIIFLIVMGGSFYAGIQYQSAKNSQSQLGQRGNFGGGANGGQRSSQGQGGGFQRQNGAGDFIAGQIVSKDDTSVTIKTKNGGSQIIFFSPSTSVEKSVAGTITDLNAGQQITANGKNNPDGSLAAQVIQIRPQQIQTQQRN